MPCRSRTSRVVRALSLTVLPAFAAIVLAAGTARAATIFSQPYQGPGPALVSDVVFGQLIADDFTLATRSIATDFHWWGAYNSGPDPDNAPDVDSLILTIYPDLASLQSLSGGTAVSLINLTRTFTGDLTPSNNAIFEYSADFAVGLHLAPGQYYALVAGDLGPFTWGWSTRPVGDSWARLTNGNWAQQIVGQAFEVTGSPVPEPGAMLLLGSALVLAAGRRRVAARG